MNQAVDISGSKTRSLRLPPATANAKAFLMGRGAKSEFRLRCSSAPELAAALSEFRPPPPQQNPAGFRAIPDHRCSPGAVAGALWVRHEPDDVPSFTANSSYVGHRSIGVVDIGQHDAIFGS